MDTHVVKVRIVQPIQFVAVVVSQTHTQSRPCKCASDRPNNILLFVSSDENGHSPPCSCPYVHTPEQNFSRSCEECTVRQPTQSSEESAVKNRHSHQNQEKFIFIFTRPNGMGATRNEEHESATERAERER